MVDPKSLLQTLNDTLHISTSEINLTRLPGDASNRTYYRLSWREGGALRSFILMVLAEPEGFKASEEAVSGAASSMTELPFINIQRHLRACKAPVPEIVFYDPKAGWLLLEDMGETLLSDAVQGLGKEGLLAYYRKAIDALLALQWEATPIPTPPTIAHGRAFDQALFVWEFDHFIEYGIEKRHGIVIPEKEKRAIRSYFSDIALRLASLPKVFTHRDYHSRNLMVQPDLAGSGAGVPTGFKIRIIDFQDALMGPCQYDLASLLRDSYVDLPEEVIDELIRYYLQEREARGGGRVQAEMFREFFDLVSIQRNLKAAGRFVYIDQVKKNSRFLPYIPPTLAKVKRNLQKHRRLTPLQTLLAAYVEELR